MGAEKDIIVAVELGSVSIRAIAGRREPDGTMLVLATAREEAAGAVRKGIVDNIDKTTQAIARVVGRIDEQLGTRTARVYVGLGGQSLHTECNRVPYQLGEKTLVTARMTDQLMDINRGVVYPDSQIQEVVPQEYLVGNRLVADPVGVQTDQLEARYMNIVARSSLAENIERCVRGAGLEVAETLIAPNCLAGAMLTANEKRSGCALVDMGADTTTVAVYANNILRHLAVIPLGGANVTADIAYKRMEPEEAETVKLKHGTARRGEPAERPAPKIQLNFDHTIGQDEVENICEARYEEIIANAWAHIKGESERLLSGVVLTGGASRARGMAEAFAAVTRTDKQIRLAKGLPANVALAPGARVPDRENLCTLMALLLKGNQPCAGEPAPEEPAVQGTINFGDSTPEPAPAVAPAPAAAGDGKGDTPSPKKKKRGEGLGNKMRKAWATLSDMLAEKDREE